MTDKNHSDPGSVEAVREMGTTAFVITQLLLPLLMLFVLVFIFSANLFFLGVVLRAFLELVL